MAPPATSVFKAIGLGDKGAAFACRVTKPLLSLLHLVLPLTIIAVLYVLLQDTEYRPLILKTLIGANIVAYIPFLINGRGNPMTLLLAVIANPALYLALVLYLDQSNLPNKAALTNFLLGFSAALSIGLVIPRLIAYNLFDLFQCGRGGVSGF
jgi:hypothetical protein